MSILAHPKYHQSGFTLIEAIVVLAIFSILAAVAMPNIGSWAAKNRLKSAGRDVYNALVKAKSQAVTLHQNVALSFGQVIDSNAQAYVVYVDDGATSLSYDIGEEILLKASSWPDGVSLDSGFGGGDGLTFTNNVDGYPTIVYQPTGVLNGTVGGTAYLVNTKSDKLSVIVSPTGAVRME